MLDSEKIIKMLDELYKSDELSVGAHGTVIPADKQENGHNKYADAFLKKGLYCCYGNFIRTVAFQDRGKYKSHGNISFEQLVNYDYSSEVVLTRSYWVEKKKSANFIMHDYVTEEIPAEQCVLVIAIPDEISTSDIEQLCSDDDGNLYPLTKLPSEDYNRPHISRSYEKSNEPIYRPLNPKYMLGYYTNNEIDSFVFNEGFYGLSIDENGEPQIDWDKIHEANEKAKRINEERSAKTQELGKETIQQQEDTEKKRSVTGIFKRLLEKINNKGREE